MVALTLTSVKGPERRRRLSGGVGLTLESEDLYEAPVVEFEGARVS